MPVGTKKVTVLRPKSNIIITGDGRVEEYDCIHCVHCQSVMRVGTDRNQSWCNKCMGPTCHKIGCCTMCVPLEKRLEMSERFALPT